MVAAWVCIIKMIQYTIETCVVRNFTFHVILCFVHKRTHIAHTHTQTHSEVRSHIVNVSFKYGRLDRICATFAHPYFMCGVYRYDDPNQPHPSTTNRFENEVHTSKRCITQWTELRSLYNTNTHTYRQSSSAIFWRWWDREPWVYGRVCVFVCDVCA